MIRTKMRGLLAGLCLLSVPASAQIFSSFAQTGATTASDAAYNKALKALDDKQWQAALSGFDDLSKQGGPRADAAQYWKAYAQNRMGQRDQALASIAALRKSHPSSRWVNDAGALEVEIRQAMGQTVSPEKTADDDLKLMALSGLMHSDPERALPILQKLLTGAQSPRVKERALFVLGQSQSPKAREILAGLARGTSNPELQKQAVRSLSIFRGKENAQLLTEIYASAASVEVKREIVRGMMISGAKERLAALAKSEKDETLRKEAIRQLGIMGDQKSLSELYAMDTSVEARKEILQAFMIGGGVERLVEAANNEKDPALRRKAVQLLGVMGREKTGDALVRLYQKESDAAVKKQVLTSLFVQGNVKPLIEIARTEKDPGLRQEAVQKLSLMKSSEATDYMMELLNR
jgi:HEAT repeats